MARGAPTTRGWDREVVLRPRRSGGLGPYTGPAGPPDPDSGLLMKSAASGFRFRLAIPLPDFNFRFLIEIQD